MLAAASVNYAPRYAIEVEELLSALAGTVTGMEVNPQLEKLGYRPPPPKYLQKIEESGTGDNRSAYDDYAADGNKNSDGYQDSDSYQDSDGYEDNRYSEDHDDNSDDTSSASYGSYSDGNSYADDSSYADTYDNYSTDDNSIGNSAYAARSEESSTGQNTSTGDALALDTALLALINGVERPISLEDGAILTDGRGDPTRGDKIKVHFQTNCRCFVYVVGVDATGFVAQIFPDPDSNVGNPVQAQRDYVLPAGDQWWGLDEQRGIEQIFFVASQTQRTDIEQAVAQLAKQPRNMVVADPLAVTTPAIIPPTRGLVKVQAPDVVLELGQQRTKVSPVSFAATLQGSDLAVTRWFRHQ